jgi:NAD(P)-dependent dehydrogenase (short-subunit alcohol dehydrogenase family)
LLSAVDARGMPTDQFSVVGRNATVTGASQGIGRTIAERLTADVVQFPASDAAAFVTGETVTVRGVPRPGNSFDVDLGLA